MFMKALVCLITLFLGQALAGPLIISSPGKIVRIKGQGDGLNVKKDMTANAVAADSVINPEVEAQMKKDFNSALEGGVIPKEGESMPWANGKLIRTGAGKLKYINTNNGYYETDIDSSTDLKKLAKESGDINNQWISQYGVNLRDLDNKTQGEANKTAMEHVYIHGLGKNYTKNNPWTFGNGIGAYNENGNVVFYNKNGPLSYGDLRNTNEYKALVGSNVLHQDEKASDKAVTEVKTAKKEDKKTAEQKNIEFNDVSNLEYIDQLRESAIKMLIKAKIKYKKGEITKDQFVDIAMQVGETADYHSKVGPEKKESLCKKLPQYPSVGIKGMDEVHQQFMDTMNKRRCSAGYDPMPGYVGDSRTSEQKINDEIEKRKELVSE